MTDALRNKLKTLPIDPGVYFHRDAKGKIIYVGKAAILKNRVMSYFHASRQRDPKTRLLVADIADTDWITVGSEAEALFLESEFIKRYKPKFNIDLKDDKNFIYVKVSADEFPVISYVRRPLDDRARYYGPFTSADALRRAMRMLRKVFPYVTHANWPKRGCLQYHLGLCPGPEEGAVTAKDYRHNIRQLELYLKGEQTKLMAQLQHDMERAAKHKDYEAAARHRDQLQDLRAFGKQMVFGDSETFDLTRDQALTGLADRLNLKAAPRRIEAYDISHLGGTGTVASMIVFSDGVPNRDEYRKFKMQLAGNNDVGHIREVISRRFSVKHLSEWPKPDLLLIDGGQPQLAAALDVLDGLGLPIPAIGLAKREEEIIRRVPAPGGGEMGRGKRNSPPTENVAQQSGPDNETLTRSFSEEGNSAQPKPEDSQAGEPAQINPENPVALADDAYIRAKGIGYESILLPPSSHVLQLLQRVRDEAHRFAITYQSLLQGKRATTSLLDTIPGVGPATRKQLIRRFGSVRGVKAASLDELAQSIGPAKAQIVAEALGQTAPTSVASAKEPVAVSDDMPLEDA